MSLQVSQPSTGVLTSAYGNRSSGWHAGVDYSAGLGNPITAFAKGTVVVALSGCVAGNNQCNGGAGNFVTIDHHNGYFTRYLHFLAIDVRVGQTVEVGQKLGSEGSTGYSTGSHLHFEIRQGDNASTSKAIDPNPFMKNEREFPSGTFYTQYVAPNKTNAVKLALFGGVALLGGYITYRFIYYKEKK